MRRLFIAVIFTLGACSAPASPPPSVPIDSPPADRVVSTGQVCGGMMGLVCADAADFCKMDISAQCGAADQTGICSPKPEMCTMDYTPVCGCDGQTYSNECAAHSAGISAAYAGECRT